MLTTLPMRRNSPRNGRPSISSIIGWLVAPGYSANHTRYLCSRLHHVFDQIINGTHASVTATSGVAYMAALAYLAVLCLPRSQAERIRRLTLY